MSRSAPSVPVPSRSIPAAVAGVLAVLALAAPPAAAQWTSDPAANTPIAVKPDQQTQPKVVALAGGGTYVSWFDADADGSPAYGYDVFLQRLDAAGNRLWAEDGVLLADRGFSSTEDYGLDVDADDHALVAFRDDRFGGVQVTVQRVAPDGTLDWGPNGVQVTSGDAVRHAPRVAGCTDGDIVVAWTEEGNLWLQRLGPDGGPKWGPGLQLRAPSGTTYDLADLHASNDGAVIVSWVHQLGWGGERHLYAQKFDAAGTPLWGTAPVKVLESGSLQMGNFPCFVPDGLGGAAFAWYTIEPLRVWAQRVRADGTEAFPHNGALASTEDVEHTSPDVAFDPGTESLFVYWAERDAYGAEGIYGQRFDEDGNRLWGDLGRPVVARDTGAERKSARTLADGVETHVYWTRSTGWSRDVLRGARVDGDGNLLHGPFDVSSAVTRKYDLDAVLDADRVAVLAWADGRNDDGDVYGQNVNPDGSLGPAGGEPPSEVSPPGSDEPLRFTDKVTLAWEEGAASGSDRFDLYRGDPRDLASGDAGSCLRHDLPENTATDEEVPDPPGSAFQYLVAGVNDAGEGPLGDASDGTPRRPGDPCP